MRSVLALGFLTFLSACSGDPRSYGITGPGTQFEPPPPPAAAADSVAVPGVSTTGPTYGPTAGPATGESGFWGYN